MTSGSGLLPPIPKAAPARASSWYFLPMLMILFGTIALLFIEYAHSPLPPGVDSGDWVQRSFAWVGLPHAPAQSIGSPYLYPPMIFPILGLLTLGTGSAATADFVFGGILLFLYGLSVIHLARRFLLFGPLQVLLVGLALFCGTTLQMLFWGGYPNFLAFVFFNEAIVFLLAFVRSRSTLDGLLFYAMVALTYLTHDLTFVLLVGTVAFAGILLLLFRKIEPRFLVRRANLAGLAMLVAVVAGYTALLNALQINQPSYLFANPTSYTLTGPGTMFAPFASAPAYFPATAATYLSARAAVGVLIGVDLGLLVALALARRYFPGRVDTRAILATAWLVVALAVAPLGYLAHVDTDYSRFVYFFPLPATLLTILTLERAGYRRIVPEFVPPTEAPTRAAPAHRRERLEVTTNLGVAIVLVVVLVAATIPMAQSNETADTATAHGSLFVQAMQWLNANPAPGAVLTQSTTIRWVEALTARGAYDVGPTWLLFEPWQIVNSEETYWALNSYVAVTNNQAVLSYSSFAPNQTNIANEAPMYSVYVDGVVLPILSILPGSILLNGTLGGVPESLGLFPGNASLTVAPSGVPAGSITYANSLGVVTEVGALGVGGTAWVNFTIAPAPGATVSSLRLNLSGPNPNAPLLNPTTVSGAALEGGDLTWSVAGSLGGLPGNHAFTTGISLEPAPSASAIAINLNPVHATLTFANPNTSGTFHLGLALSTPGTSNPAVQLPTVLNGSSFLDSHDIHFVLLPNQKQFLANAEFFELEYGYQVVYVNPQWQILQNHQ